MLEYHLEWKRIGGMRRMAWKSCTFERPSDQAAIDTARHWAARQYDGTCMRDVDMRIQWVLTIFYASGKTSCVGIGIN